MTRIEEIEKRISEIKIEVNDPKSDIDALDKEIDALVQERKALIEAGQKRMALLESIKNGAGTVIASQKEGENSMPEKRTFAIDSVEYREAYLKSLQGRELDVEERAAITASSVIPTQTLNKIQEKLEQTSVLYRYITVLNIASNVSIPTENACADASWIGMSSASSDSADSTSSVSLSAHKLIKTLEIDADVMAMSIDAFEAYIVNKLVKKISRAVENAILNGNNSGQPKGILAETYTTAGDGANYVTVASGSTIGWDNVMDMIALLPTEYAQDAKIILNRKMLYKTLGKIKASTAGVPMFVMNSEEGFAGKIMGYPVIVDDLMGDRDILFGDLSSYHFNWAKPVQISKDDSVGFRTGSTAYRAMALADGELVDKLAFVKLTHLTA